MLNIMKRITFGLHSGDGDGSLTPSCCLQAALIARSWWLRTIQCTSVHSPFPGHLHLNHRNTAPNNTKNHLQGKIPAKLPSSEPECPAPLSCSVWKNPSPLSQWSGCFKYRLLNPAAAPSYCCITSSPLLLHVAHSERVKQSFFTLVFLVRVTICCFPRVLSCSLRTPVSDYSYCR